MTHRIGPLGLEHLEAFMAHVVVIVHSSGRDGDIIHNPYSKDHVYDAEVARARRTEAWPKPLSEPGWTRSWGAWSGDRLVGHVDLHGSKMATASHRCTLGIGIERGHRDQGNGTALMNACIAWARAQPELAWIDLGVFSNNARAIALYEKLGFERIGETRDRFRVDGVSITDISMALAVG